MRRLINKTTLSVTTACAVTLGVALTVKFALPATAFANTMARFDAAMIDVSAALGMKLDALTVEGRGMTAREDLLDAMDIERGAPILAIDMAQARADIEALPWVKTAKVERRLPGSVHILLEERTPYALWQRTGRYTLVDRDGKTIVDVPNADQSLPLIVGPDAPEHAAELFEALNGDAALASRVRAAVRVGARRWNVYLDSFEGGIAIRLPEDNISAAWTRLAGLENEHKILERDLDFIDMRIEDRLVVRVRKDPAAEAKKKKPPVATGPKQNI